MHNLAKLIMDRHHPGTFPVLNKRLAAEVAADLEEAIAPQYEVVIGDSADIAFGASIVIQERGVLTRPRKPR